MHACAPGKTASVMEAIAGRLAAPDKLNGESMKFKIALAAAALALAGSASAQTKWDLPSAYPASNFHTANLEEFASDVDKATHGKLKIQVHATAALFTAPEIKRAVQGG